jgi:hypothetical protein
MRFPSCRTVILLFLLLLQASGLCAQTSFLKRVSSFKTLLSEAEELRPFGDGGYDKIEAVNEQITKRLSALLADPALRRYRPDSLLRHSFLDCAVSPDRRIFVWSWYENTGGSFHSYCTVVAWRRADGSFGINDDYTIWNGMPPSRIYRLQSPGRSLYLCLGGGRGCNTCAFEKATALEIKGNRILFDLRLFLQESEEGKARQWGPSFELRARMGNIEKFEFNPRTQTLSFAYITDDMTPVSNDEQSRISRHLTFNGTRFIGDGYK